jgi:hypothetical protein
VTEDLAAPLATGQTAPARRQLGRWSRRTLRAVAEVVTPREHGAPPPDLDGIVAFADDWVRYMPRLFRVLFPVGLMILELGAFLLGPSLVPFSFMSLERRRRYVAAFAHGRSALRRDLIKGIKGLCLLQYYSDPKVSAQLGYHVDEHVTLVRAERLKRHGHEL